MDQMVADLVEEEPRKPLPIYGDVVREKRFDPNQDPRARATRAFRQQENFKGALVKSDTEASGDEEEKKKPSSSSSESDSEAFAKYRKDARSRALKKDFKEAEEYEGKVSKGKVEKREF